MAWSLITHGTGSGGTNPTTGALNTTGSDLFVAVVEWFQGTPTNVTDSQNNTWSSLTAQSTGNSHSQIWYVHAPTTNASQTFTFNGSSIFGSICVRAYSGSATSPFDKQNGAIASSVTSIQTGSITPSANGALIVAGWASTGVSNPSIDSSFTVGDNLPFTGGSNGGNADATLIQTSAAAVNPTWSWAGSDNVAATIASFLVSAGGASLTATSITLSEVLGHPSISQTHVLSGTGIHTAPVLGTPTIIQIQALSAKSLTGHIPVLGAPTLASGATALVANGIIMRPVFSTPDIGPLPTAIFRGAPVWWRGWPFDEEEEEKPDVVNEIIEVPETPHETPTEDVVIARAKTIGVRLTPIQYDQVISRTLESMRDELKTMKREGRSMREAQDRVEREIRKRAKRLKEDEEMMLLS